MWKLLCLYSSWTLRTLWDLRPTGPGPYKPSLLQSHAIERPEDAMKARGLHWSELRIAVT
jgi:hypothetical protein